MAAITNVFLITILHLFISCVVLKTKTALKKHILSHMDPSTVYKCDLCDKIFKSYYSRGIHNNAHHSKSCSTDSSSHDGIIDQQVGMLLSYNLSDNTL